jgi:peptidyl-prolyl cis-trans isomerase SurA
MKRTSPHKANLKEDYNLIKTAAENQKKGETVNKWIKSKIGSTYIKIDEEYHDCDFVNPWLKK